MDAAGAAFRTMACGPQIGLGEIPLQEWKTQMRSGCKRCDVRGSGRRARSGSDDERWRRVHCLGHIHEAHFGNTSETATALDSEIQRVFLAAIFCVAFKFFYEHYGSAGESR